ncbi:MAG: hemerythrin domain-containing protein [Elusimicrobiota bacterium]
MSVFASLAREHALLLRLVARLERGAADPDPRVAARETRNVLLVLFKALEAHERLEDAVFAATPERPSLAAAKALAEVEKQHRALGVLREEASQAMRSLDPEGGETIRAVGVRLAHLLRGHFNEEERRLWPSFNTYASRSTLNLLSRRAERQVVEMERELDRYWEAIGDYLTGDR